jgi:hypothetical protein
MATKAIVLEWGMPIEGRELKALETFASNVAYWTELQSSGKIERFNSYGGLTGNMTERAGFVILEGTNEQIDNLGIDETWRSNLTGILTIGQNVQVNILETGDEMQNRMQRYAKSVKLLG